MVPSSCPADRKLVTSPRTWRDQFFQLMSPSSSAMHPSLLQTRL